MPGTDLRMDARRRALSAGRRLGQAGWQAGAGPANRASMIRALTAVRLWALPLLCTAGAVSAAPGGPLGTLPLGHYRCELPGDAVGPAGIRQPAADFTVIHASSYRTASGFGVYLLTGDRLTFTSGPLDGVRFHRLSGGFLRRSEADGSDGPLRCVRRVGGEPR